MVRILKKSVLISSFGFPHIVMLKGRLVYLENFENCLSASSMLPLKQC